MRLGISSYTYVWAAGVPGYEQPAQPMTAGNLLDKAVGLGVRLVQIADNIAIDRLPPNELDELSKRAKTAGIDLEAGTSGIDPERLLAALRTASRWGSPLLRVVLDTNSHRPTVDEVLAMLRELLPAFERANVILAIENHDRFESRTLLKILERVGSDHLGICFDTANSIGCLESAERVLDTLGKHIVNVHLKDYCLFRPPHHKGYVAEGRPAGQGQLDVPRLLDRVISFGRDPNVVLELWPPPQPTLRESIAFENVWAEESVRYLRRYIPQ